METLPWINGSLTSADGLDLFYRYLVSPDERARLVIAHGLGEHSGRYGHVYEWLRPKGYSFWALDHRGHGRSQGRKGHVLDFKEYLTDLGLLIQRVRENLPAGRKVFLLGHSLGGLIALRFALEYPELINGVIASSPALGVAMAVPAVKSALGRLMSSIWPTLGLASGLDPNLISRDPETVAAYRNDSLVHDRVTARWFTEFTSSQQKTQEQAASMKTPTLLQVAGADGLVSPLAAKEFFDRLGLADKTLHVYEGLYHEIYNERPEDRARVLRDLEAWLGARLV
ncbi:MAG: lysophospholipase [Thermodesulfobacteriota bacterium]